MDDKNQDQDYQDQQEIWNAFLAEQSAKNDAITEEAYHEFMRAVHNGDTDALQFFADNAWEFAPTATEDEGTEDLDAKAEEAYVAFMEAVHNGDTDDLELFWNAFLAEQSAKKDAMEYTPTTKEDEGTGKDAPRFQTDEDDVWITHQTPTEQDEVIIRTFPMPYPEYLDDLEWDVSLWDLVPTATEEVAPAPRFVSQSAPRFQDLLKKWHEAHPDAFKDEDDDEWVNNTTPTEKDGVIPHYTIPMPYPEDLDDEEMGYVDEDFDSGWRYYRTPEDEDAFVAVAPSFRAYRAFIRGERKQWVSNLRVVRVTWRR